MDTTMSEPAFEDETPTEEVPAHQPAPETHCIPCDVPWGFRHVSDTDGNGYTEEACLRCGALKPGTGRVPATF